MNYNFVHSLLLINYGIGLARVICLSAAEGRQCVKQFDAIKLRTIRCWTHQGYFFEARPKAASAERTPRCWTDKGYFFEARPKAASAERSLAR